MKNEEPGSESKDGEPGSQSKAEENGSATNDDEPRSQAKSNDLNERDTFEPSSGEDTKTIELALEQILQKTIP